MGIAILTIVDLLMPLQTLASRFMPARRAHASGLLRRTTTGHRVGAADAANDRALHVATEQLVPSSAAKVRPLRVVRVEAQQAGHRSGRVVISGRIADVCAELDRLAALEAAQMARLH